MIVLHIGYPKTGTTWLQKNFFSNIRKDEIILLIRNLEILDILMFMISH